MRSAGPHWRSAAELGRPTVDFTNPPSAALPAWFMSRLPGWTDFFFQCLHKKNHRGKEHKSMAERFDVYSDSVGLSSSDWGSCLYINVQAVPESHGGAPSPIPMHLGTVRMSNEHLKAVAFMLRRQIQQHEARIGVTYQVSDQVLAAMQISKDEWAAFWGE